jgi:hypothetical protein
VHVKLAYKLLDTPLQVVAVVLAGSFIVDGNFILTFELGKCNRDT